MNIEQFEVLAELLRLRSGPARECARLVIVDGLSVKAAAESVGLSYRQGAAAAQRVKKGHEMAKKATT